MFTRTRVTFHNVPPFGFGAVAQLIERFVRNEEVVGLIPICSTRNLEEKGSLIGVLRLSADAPGE